MVVGSEDHDRRARRRRVCGARCCRSAARAPAAARRLRCSDAPVRLVRPRMHDRRWISRRRPRRLRYTLGAVLRTRFDQHHKLFTGETNLWVVHIRQPLEAGLPSGAVSEQLGAPASKHGGADSARGCGGRCWRRWRQASSASRLRRVRGGSHEHAVGAEHAFGVVAGRKKQATEAGPHERPRALRPLCLRLVLRQPANPRVQQEAARLRLVRGSAA